MNLQPIAQLSSKVDKSIETVQFIFLLGLRLWLAKVFFMSGLTKIQSWETTMMLFEYEYAVPLLPAALAAWLATIAELVIPVLLVVGLFSRLTILALFVFNFIAAISYPDISPAGEKDHLIWGLMCMVIFFYGAGKASLDEFLKRRFLSIK